MKLNMRILIQRDFYLNMDFFFFFYKVSRTIRLSMTELTIRNQFVLIIKELRRAALEKMLDK